MLTAGILLRRIRAIFADRPTGFVWVSPGSLAGSGYPASRGQVDWLASHGIDSILTLTEDPIPRPWLRQSINYTHIPMRDHQPPNQASLASAADRIEEELKAGRVVLVHCQAGKGRTMCAIGAYMISSTGLGAEEVLASLRKVRPGAVERRQEAALSEFESRLRKGPSGDRSA